MYDLWYHRGRRILYNSVFTAFPIALISRHEKNLAFMHPGSITVPITHFLFQEYRNGKL